MIIKKRHKQRQNFLKINEQITYQKVRVVGSDGSNLGLMTSVDALKKAKDSNLDLVEISNKDTIVIVRIVDLGKFKYEEKKKNQKHKKNQKITETKTIQVKTTTSENDLILKAKNISKWLKENHRIKIDLFLPGRNKYLDKDFLNERINRVLFFISIDFKIASNIKKSNKGLTIEIEKK